MDVPLMYIGEVVVPTGIVLPDKKTIVPYRAMDRVLAKHPCGQYLKDFSRFGKFKDPSVTEPEWADQIGIHGRNLNHNWAARQEMFDLVRGLNSRPNSNRDLFAYLNSHPYELATIGVGITYHDVPEYYVDDYPSGTKPKVLRDVEFIIMREMGQMLLEPLFTRNQRGLAKKVVDEAVDILQNPGHPLTVMFKVAEVNTHAQAAESAWVNSYKTEGELSRRLRWMGADATSNHMEFLLQQSSHHPHIENELKARAEIHNDIFSSPPSWIYEFYQDPKEQKGASDKFTKAARLWQAYSDPLRRRPANRNIFVQTKDNNVAIQGALL